MFSFHSISFPFWENLEAWIMQSRINTSFSRSYVLLISQPALTPSLNAYQLTLLRTWHVKGKWRQKYHFQVSRWQKSGVDLSCSIWRSHFQCKEWVGIQWNVMPKIRIFLLASRGQRKKRLRRGCSRNPIFSTYYLNNVEQSCEERTSKGSFIIKLPMLVGEPFLIDVEIEVF